jgi:putative ABC transport system permease protein
MSRSQRIARDAVASLRADRHRALIMALGIAAGAAVLSAVIAIGQGTRDRVMALVSKAGLDMVMVRAGGEVQVFAPRADRGLAALFVEDARAIATLPNVEMTSAVQNQRGITVVSGDRSVVTRGFGVEPSWIEIRRWAVTDGEFVSDADMWGMSRVVMLGAKVARELFPNGGAVGSTVRIANEPYTVKGVFLEMGTNAGGDDWDDRVVVPLSTATRRLFGRPYLEQIVIRVSDPRRVPETAERVRELLRVRHDIASGQPDDFFVREPEDIEDAALETSSTLRSLLLAAGIVALFAGGVVIMNLMLLGVSRRASEIGVRRAAGARAKDIARQFFLESVLISLAGGFAGLLLGIAVALGLSMSGVAPARVTWAPVAGTLVACVVIGVLAGLQPARRAARMEPATILRTGT